MMTSRASRNDVDSIPRRATGSALLLSVAIAFGCASTPSKPAPRLTPGDTTGAIVNVWVTTGDKTKLLAPQPAVRFRGGQPNATYILQVDRDSAYQEIVGFGAAITGASAWLIQTKLTQAQRDSLLTQLFSPTQGIGLGFTRLTMGASDFSLNHFSYDDMPPGQTDPDLTRFSVDADRETVIPVTKRALEINPDLRIMASPWSPPGWMKTTDSLIKGRLRPEAYEPFANYFLKFLQAYEAEGIPIYAISVQNEPHFEPDSYPGMRMEPPERARFIGGHLGPLLERSTFDPLILDWDHNWDEYESPMQTLSDTIARRYIDGVAWHCYGGDVSAQSRVHQAHPDKDTFFTECSGGEWAPIFADNLKWVVRTLIIGTSRHWSRGTILWNLALDPSHGPHAGGCDDCRGVVTIDPNTGRWTYNEEFYALGHASKFVRPGARRIESTAAIGGLESVAFRNPDRAEVLIVLNTATEGREFAIRAAEVWFAYSLPAGAVATFHWR
jgi:glucosylceramidase